MVGLLADGLTRLQPRGRPVLVRTLQLFDPAVQRRQQAVLLVDHPLPHRGVHEQVTRGLGAERGTVLHTAGRHRQPQHVVVAHRAVDGGPPVQRRLEQHALTPAHPEREGVLQQAERGVPGVVVAAVLVLVRPLVVLRPVQLAQRYPAQHARLEGPPDQGVLRALDRAQDEGPRLQTAQEVPVPLLRGVHREEVEGAAHDEPQDLRPFQRQTPQPGAVDRLAEASQRCDDRVVRRGLRARERMDGCHVSAP